MDNPWFVWNKTIDSHPFAVIFAMFISVFAYETYKGKWEITLILFAVSLPLAIIVSIVLKNYYKVTRGKPVENIMDYRRPSAHTLIATTLATVASLSDHVLVFVLMPLAFATGYSRIYMFRHNTWEVIEGGIEGLLLGALIFFSINLGNIYI